MGTTYKQDADFLKYVVGAGLLEASIEWIAKNMEPEDVFPNEKLSQWAEDVGYIKEDS